MSARASPMSRSRCFASFSRHRDSSRRTLGGVAAGNAAQSGSRSRIAANLSEKTDEIGVRLWTESFPVSRWVHRKTIWVINAALQRGDSTTKPY